MKTRIFATIALLGLVALPAQATLSFSSPASISASNGSPSSIATAISNSSLVPDIPSDVHLTLLGDWEPSGWQSGSLTSFTNYATVTPNRSTTWATVNYNPGPSSPMLYFIASIGGSGRSHTYNVYFNDSSSSLQPLATPLKDFVVSSTINGGCKLSAFSHIYFFGTLSPVPEPSALITGISLLFLGFVTIRARRKAKLAKA